MGVVLLLSYLPLTLVSHHAGSHKHGKLICETDAEVTEGIQCSHIGEQPPLLLYMEEGREKEGRMCTWTHGGHVCKIEKGGVGTMCVGEGEQERGMARERGDKRERDGKREE